MSDIFDKITETETAGDIFDKVAEADSTGDVFDTVSQPDTDTATIPLPHENQPYGFRTIQGQDGSYQIVQTTPFMPIELHIAEQQIKEKWDTALKLGVPPVVAEKLLEKGNDGIKTIIPLLDRAIKGFLYRITEPIRQIQTKSNAAETARLLKQFELIKKFKDREKRTPTYQEFQEIAKAVGINSQENIQKYWLFLQNVPPESIAEKAVDVSAGVAAFITQLLAAKAIIGGTGASSEIMALELASESNGGAPGSGAILGVSLGIVGGIPALTPVAKIGKTVAEGGVLAGATALEGGSPEDVAIAFFLPGILRTFKAFPNLVKGEYELRQNINKLHEQYPLTRDMPKEMVRDWGKAVIDAEKVRLNQMTPQEWGQKHARNLFKIRETIIKGMAKVARLLPKPKPTEVPPETVHTEPSITELAAKVRKEGEINAEQGQILQAAQSAAGQPVKGDMAVESADKVKQQQVLPVYINKKIKALESENYDDKTYAQLNASVREIRKIIAKNPQLQDRLQPLLDNIRQKAKGKYKTHAKIIEITKEIKNHPLYKETDEEYFKVAHLLTFDPRDPIYIFPEDWPEVWDEIDGNPYLMKCFKKWQPGNKPAAKLDEWARGVAIGEEILSPEERESMAEKLTGFEHVKPVDLFTTAIRAAYELKLGKKGALNETIIRHILSRERRHPDYPQFEWLTIKKNLIEQEYSDEEIKFAEQEYFKEIENAYKPAQEESIERVEEADERDYDYTQPESQEQITDFLEGLTEDIDAKPTDLFGMPVFDKLTGEQKEFGFDVKSAEEKEVPVKEDLLAEVLDQFINKNTSDPQEIAENIASQKEIFNNPANPLPEIKTALKIIQQGSNIFDQHRMSGFAVLPPVDTIDVVESKLKENPNIKIVKKPKDINPILAFMGTITNQAILSGDPEAIEATVIMADTGLVIANKTQAELAKFEDLIKKLPREYRKNSDKMFDLMDSKLSPDDIEKATDIPKEVKPVLIELKKIEEEHRIYMRDEKRRITQTVLENKTIPELDKYVLKYNLPYEVGLRNIGGREVGQFFDIKNNKWVSKKIVAENISRMEIPDSWGRQWQHIAHYFFGRFELRWSKQNPETHEIESHFIDRAETLAQAVDKLITWKKARIETVGDMDEITLTADPVFHIPYDVARLKRKQYEVILNNMREAADLSREEVKDAVRGIIGKKEDKQKFFGQQLKRWGMQGFSKDFERVWRTSVSQFIRWKYLNQMNREVQPIIESLSSSGKPRWARRLEQAKDTMWGTRRSNVAKWVDEKLAEIPIIKNYVKPFALERIMNIVREVIFWNDLQTIRGGTLNSLQLAQTLYSIVGEKGIYEATKLYYTNEGKELLKKYNIVGVYGKAGEHHPLRGHKWMRFTPFGGSEFRNQGVAFLALYKYGKSVGMTDEKAARLGRVRGQIFTQFMFVDVDVPQFMEGPILGTIFLYKRFTIKGLEMVAILAKLRQYGALARMLSVLVLIGGINALLPDFGSIRKKIYDYVKKKTNKQTADVIDHGLPGLIGIDMSGSVSPVIIPMGETVEEKIGRLLTGPAINKTIQLIESAYEDKVASESSELERIFRQMISVSPILAQFVYLIKAINKDTDSFDVRERMQYDLSVWDLWKKAFGFRPEAESWQRMQYQAFRQFLDEYNRTINLAVSHIFNEDPNALFKTVREWNSIFPEAPITIEAVIKRAKERKVSNAVPMVLRGFMKLPNDIKAHFAPEIAEFVDRYTKNQNNNERPTNE